MSILRHQFHCLPLHAPKLHSRLTTTAPPPPPPPSLTSDPSSLATLILNFTNPDALTQTLHGPTLQWTPQLVDLVLKRLWNHALKALHFFNILSRHPTYTHSLSSFDHAVDLATRLRDYKTVWTLIHRMKSLRLGPTPKTFAIIAERYVSAGKADRAVKLFLSMHEHGCRQSLNSFNTILDLLCKEKKVEKAYYLFKVFRGKFNADVVTYNVIANGWCLIKRTNKALEILKEMVERGIDPTLTTYNIILKGYFRAGQIEEAWKFFFEMKKRNCEIDVVTYTTVVHGFGVVGEIERARRVFDDMVKEGVLPSVVTYNALIQVLCKKDSVENAVMLVKWKEGLNREIE